MEKQQYKAVFSDIDGTLITSQHQISPKTEQAIKRIVQMGIPFVPVSARTPLTITPYRDQLETNNAIVCYSGALILDRDLQPLYSVSLLKEDLTQLEVALEAFSHLSISHFAGIDWFTNNPSSEWIQLEESIVKQKAKLKPAQLDEVHKILVMGDASEILKVEQALKQQFPHLSIHRSKDEYLEIMHQGATKSSAIRFLEGVFGVQQAEVVAFGDSFNDLDMLQYAGLGVAMGNAPEAIKAAANRVTANNNEDGIALVLNEVF